MDERLRRGYLEAMGVPLWLPREVVGGDERLASVAEVPPSPVPVAAPAPERPSRPVAAPPRARADIPDVAPERRTDAPSPPPPRPSPAPRDPASSPPSPGDAHPSAPFDGPPPEWDDIPPYDGCEVPLFAEVEREYDLPEAPRAAAAPPRPVTWEELERQVEGCTACPELVANRSRTVFGVGNRDADWMVVGEAPGRDEDLKGEPFVGRAGKLLDEMLFAAGFPREQVFIANVLKCRPPNNRDPQPEEAAKCQSFLRGQIALVKPRVLLAVGRIAAQNLLGSSESIGRLRGRVHDYGGTPLVVTYHPAYLLRSPQQKRAAWEDLKLALSVFRGARGR